VSPDDQRDEREPSHNDNGEGGNLCPNEGTERAEKKGERKKGDGNKPNYKLPRE
jgi:hypothetical protein